MRAALPLAVLTALLIAAVPVLANQVAPPDPQEESERTQEAIAEKTAGTNAEAKRLVQQVEAAVAAAQAEVEERQAAVAQAVEETHRAGEKLLQETQGQAQSTAGEAQSAIGQTLHDATEEVTPGEAVDEEAPPFEDEALPPMSDRIRAAIADEVMMAGVVSTAAVGATATMFAVVTRYISPKEALRNPQRAMLYGFVRAQPGAHLKQVADEFQMKTSSILWHMRKLEDAGLVQSERANGFRVFYPVEGGIEIKRVSRALTALQNGNARHIYELVDGRPGQTTRDISDRLGVHVGTVRWHLRKLREFGLVDELVREDGSMFYPTPLGQKALHAAVGRPVLEPGRVSAVAPVKA